MVDHETREAQGELQLGPEQVPEAGRPDRPGAQGAPQVADRSGANQDRRASHKFGSEPNTASEPRASEGTTPSERVNTIERTIRAERATRIDRNTNAERAKFQERTKVSERSKRRPIDLPYKASEQEFHQSIAALLDWILKPPIVWTTFPAGWGKLTKGTAGRLHASGLKKGMPDILVFDRDRAIGIELKTGIGRSSSAQRDMAAKLQAVGVRVYVCRSMEDVLSALRDAGIEHLRTTLSGSYR